MPGMTVTTRFPMELVPNGSKKTAQCLWTLWRPWEFAGMGPGFFQWRLQCWCKRSDGPERSIGGWRSGHSRRLLFWVQEKDALISSSTQNETSKSVGVRIRLCADPWKVPFLKRFDHFQKSLLWEIGNLRSIHKKNLFTSFWERSTYPNLPCLSRFCSLWAWLSFAKVFFPYP